MWITQTESGLDHIEFDDAAFENCTLEQVSTGDDARIMLGVKPRLDRKCGSVGWVEEQLRDDQLIVSRMNLNRDMACALVRLLQNFVAFGKLAADEEAQTSAVYQRADEAREEIQPSQPYD